MTDEDIENEVRNDKRDEFYVDQIMKEMEPKFNLIPGAMYKTIVGVAEPSHIDSKTLREGSGYKG